MATKFVRFACPNCQKKLKANRPTEAGKTTRCPYCGCRITVPVPVANPQNRDGAGARSTIQMEAYEGRESTHLPSQPAKNPLIYALGGALLAVALGGGMYAAYTAGKGNTVAVAGGDPADETVLPSAPVETELGNMRSPVPNRQETQNASTSQTPRPANANNAVNSGDANSRLSNATQADADGNIDADKEADFSTSEPPDEPFPVNEANRPSADPLELMQPRATGTKPPPAPVFVEVPVFVPSAFFGVATGQLPGALPDLSVVIAPLDKKTSVMKIDHLGKPGVSTKLTITLDKTPSTAVKIAIAPDTGLLVDQKALTFPANVAPVKQVVTISGDGKASMPLGPSKIFYLNVTATGGGLAAGSPAKIPVLLQRRNSFQVTGGITINRSDMTPPGNPSPVLSDWTFSGTGGLPILKGEEYTADYVQLRGPLRRFRFFDDHIEVEQPTNSGTYQSVATGTWK